MSYTEEYVGVKFRHVKEGELEFDSSLNEIALQLQKALSELPPETLEGVTGNISARLSDGILISATRSKLKNLMVPQDLSKVVENTLGGDIIRYYGSKIPSSETPMHLQVYQNRPDVRFCLHLHLPNLEKLQLLNRFPITKEAYPYGTWELAREATKALGSNDFVILRDHGILAVGNNLDDIIQKIISISQI